MNVVAAATARRRHQQQQQHGHGSRSGGAALVSTRTKWTIVVLLLGTVVLTVNIAFFRHAFSASSFSPSSATNIRRSDDGAGTNQAQDHAAAAEADALLAESLWRVASDCPTPRGIVLPLFDDIATLGVSLILELRDMGVDLPIEVPHCGDLDAALYEKLVQQDRKVRVYDICVQAASLVDQTTGKPLFCNGLSDCHGRFRSFDIKILALVLSRFQQVMLLDADTLFFQNPMDLWETNKYTATGTLFFHDRISYERHYLAQRVIPGREKIGAIHEFLSGFQVAPFHALAAIARPPSALTRLSPLDFSFEPSEFLMTSHSWALRAGHQMDSSLVLWHKLRQPRATAILASFISKELHPRRRSTPRGLQGGTPPPPPSYGDKELYFLACELAETQYAFSEHAVGTLGVDLLWDLGDDKSVLCGDALHFFPEPVTRGLEPQPLYINSDNMLSWSASQSQIYRTKAKPAMQYPGSFTTLGLEQTCPFNVTLVPLMQVEAALLLRRQQLHKTAETWAATSGYTPENKKSKGFWKLLDWS